MSEDLGMSTSRKAARTALGIAGVYAAMGIAWILLSDFFVAAVSTEPGWLVLAQRYKGLFFVLATAACVAALVHWGYVRLLHADAAAQARELQVQDLFLRHPKPMWVHDVETLAFLKVNDAAVDFYGWSESEFLAMKLSDLRPAHDACELADPGSGRAAPHRDAGPSRHRKKSGEVAHVHVSEHIVAYEGRAAVMAMAIDVTQEVRSKRALQRQDLQFRQLHESLGDVLWLASPSEGRILYVTPAFEQLYGRPAADLERDPRLWLSMVVEADRERALASSRELHATGRSACEYRIRRPDGTVRWISDRKKAIVDDEGLVWMIGGIAEDITASKELEAAREADQAELERMVAKRTAELERVNAELDAFCRTAAHDLKAPLNVIVGASELLRMKYEDSLDEDGRRRAEHIGTSASRMASLIDALLMLSRVAHAPFEPKDVDLAPIAKEVIDALRWQHPDRAVLFDAPAHLPVSCDAGLARSLLANLLGNAWKFTGEREHALVRIRSSRTEDSVVLRIEDNGAGFDAMNAKTLFSPFQRFHAPSRFDGTGIGLVTCQRIVQRHGGQISVDSHPGEGTAVTFTLPLPDGAPGPLPVAG